MTASPRRRSVVAMIAAAAGLGLLAMLLWPGAESRPSTGGGQSALPASPEPALDVGAPAGLSGERHVSTWTTVRSAVVAR